MPSSPVNVLLVDDDPLARQVIGDYLSAAGYRVAAVCDAVFASEALARESFDVVVTDLLLPRGDGLAVLAEVKRRDPDIEVIVITALERVDPAVRAIKGGAADYLVKPVAPDALQAAIARCVAKRQLLRDNETLRAHLGLVDAGQRLATTLERDKLFPMAAEALRRTLSADGALLFSRRADAGWVPAAQSGFDEAAAAALNAQALPLLATTDHDVSTLRIGNEIFALLLAEEAGTTYGACLLRQPSFEGASWANATYLMRQLAIALKNLDRFSAVEDLAYLDDLTRLYNTRYLHVALDREINRALQTGASFSVLFLDVDHFKAVNDTHGHLVGSKVLVEMGALLKGCVRDVDVVVRYGGDEYVVLLLATDE
ncbi:MAG: diguanylate cyclase, partial [Myxococcales bacterium]